nr:MAG TPA: hypothetical protein [Caudoviricetes sp.]
MSLRKSSLTIKKCEKNCVCIDIMIYLRYY